MAYDPADPRSEADQANDQAQGQTFTNNLMSAWTDLPDVQAWMQAHPNGAQNANDRKQLEQIQLAHPGVVPKGYVVQDSGKLGPTTEGMPFWKQALIGAGYLTAASLVAEGLGGLAGGASAGSSSAAPAAGAYAGDFATVPVAGAGGATAATGSTLSALSGAGTAAPVAGGAAPLGGAYAGDLATVPTAGAGGAAAPSTFSSFVKTLTSPTVVGGATSIIGGLIQAGAQKDATAAQIQAGKDALGVATQEYNNNTGLNVDQYNTDTGLKVSGSNQKTQAYNTTLANLAGYRQAGAGALSLLGYGLGIPGYQQGNQTVVNPPPPSQPVDPLSFTPVTKPAPINVPGTTANAAPAPAGNGTPPVGTKSNINGQSVTWDGQGWKAA